MSDLLYTEFQSCASGDAVIELVFHAHRVLGAHLIGTICHVAVVEIEIRLCALTHQIAELRTKLEEELYNERSYKSMVGYFAQHATNEELVVTGIETAWDYLQGQTIEEEMAQDAAYQKDKSAIEEQLDQVKKELHEIEVLYK